MASIRMTTGADVIGYDVKHPNERQNPYEGFAASSETEINHDDVSVYLINAGELTTCPRVRVTFKNFSCEFIIDTGSQVSVLSYGIYRKLKLQREPMQELPVQSVVLMSAFGNKTSRVRKQVLIPFRISDCEFENNFLICPQLVSPGLLEADFCTPINFPLIWEKSAWHEQYKAKR